MLQGFTSSDTKQNLHLQSVTRASFLHSGSIFFWRPLHHSARSRGWALCLNTFFVFASVAGGYWRAFGSSGFAHLSSIALKHAVRVRFGFGSSGLRLAFQSSLFRGLFFCWMRSRFQKLTLEIIKNTIKDIPPEILPFCFRVKLIDNQVEIRFIDTANKSF